MQKRRADQVRGVARAQLPHRFGAVALKRPRADPHPQGALLVRIALADQLQDLALAPRERLLARFRRQYDTWRTAAVLAASHTADFDSRRLRTSKLLDHGANPFGLQERVFYDLLQIVAIT